ncbi:hypothetical protein [Algoriphagus sp.]|uniref:hypothetical protein n=1 Tax=Algoriphagus sp. TaxID=1872435 RepID=UPI00260A5D46|nr:hypothetical protein [Algoriphagus sp.]
MEAATRPQSPIRDWYYFYREEEKLLFKSISKAPNGELAPMFEYNYDPEGGLFKEQEQYPNMDFGNRFQ